MEIRDDYFDFVDFFDLIKKSCPKTSDTDIFRELLDYLYYKSNVSFKSPKDDVSDIKNKKKAFTIKIRENAEMGAISKIAETLQSPLISSYIYDVNQLIDQLIFIVEKEQTFFNKSDVNFLYEHRSYPSYVLAYILIKTIQSSPQAKKYKHSKNYNTLEGYIKESEIKNSFQVNNSFLNKMKALSIYQYQNFSQLKNSEYNGELLSRGAEIFINKFDTFKESSFTLNAHIQNTDFSNNNAPNDDTYSDSKLVDLYQGSDNILIIGEGGIGKTTFLYSRLKDFAENKSTKSVPIYIKLSDCSPTNDRKHMIMDSLINTMNWGLSGKVSESYKDIAEEFNKSTDHPEYTLLLDGFNEITPMDFGEIRTSIANEINIFASMSNIRIILTTREIELYSLALTRFCIIKASGISEQEVIAYLDIKYDKKTIDIITSNKTLIKCLQIPLFLLMFEYSTNPYCTIPKDRGTILYNFYNSSNSIYSEKINADEKTERKLYILINLLLDFIIPDIGFYMEEQNKFSISWNEFETIIKSSETIISDFVTCHTPIYDTYKKGQNNLRRSLSLLKEIDLYDLFVIARDFIGVFYQSYDEYIGFTHQYIRDYFSALFCIRSLYYAASNKNSSTPFIHFPFDIMSITGWEPSRISMLKEIFPSVAQSFGNERLLFDILNLCRNNSNDYHIYGIILPNIIRIISNINNGDLSYYDFSKLNLTNCHLADQNFNNIITGKHSSFEYSYIMDTTFSVSEHSDRLQKWKLLDDNQHILSISDTNEVKLWNISTQKCIFTLQLPLSNSKHLSSDSRIYDIDFFIANKTAYILATYINDLEGNSLSSCITYNIISKSMTYYKMSDECDTHDYFVYFGYNSIGNNIYAITRYGNLLWYSLDDEHSNNCIKLNPEFSNRINTHFLNMVLLKVVVRVPTKRIIFTPNNQILYLESDLAGNYYHGLDNKIYSINDNNTPINKNIVFDEVYKSGHNKHRNINIFVYDIIEQSLNSLQLENEHGTIYNTTLEIPEEITSDVLNQYIAISHDKKRIVLHNTMDIYAYDLDNGDYMFKKICKLPDYINSYISFRHEDNNILTIYNESRIIQLDLNTENILYKTMLFNRIHSNYFCTDKYRIAESSYPGAFEITNYYSGTRSTLRLTLDDVIIKYLFNGDNIYILFNNGTIISLNAKTLSFQSCYNYCPGRHVINATYDEHTNSICFISSPHHSFISSDTMSLTRVNLSTGIFTNSAYNLDTIDYISFVISGKYIVAISHENNIYLFDSEMLTELDHTLLLKDYTFDPIKVYSHNDYIYVFMSNMKLSAKFGDPDPLSNDLLYKEYHGILLKYTVSNGKLKLLCKNYIPRFDEENSTGNFYLNEIANSSFYLMKSIEKSDEKIFYPAFNSETDLDTFEDIENSISSWNIVYITKILVNDKHLEVPSTETNIYILNNVTTANSKYLILYDLSYYIFDINSKEIEAISDDIDISTCIYNEYLNLLYFQSKDNNTQLLCYDIDKAKITHRSPILQPNILTQECSFNGCTNVEYIPNYLLSDAENK